MTSLILKHTKASKLIGEYFLQGILKTTSGFQFNADATFSFYYSYGDINRTGAGTYSIKKDMVILNSSSRKKDFRLTESKANSFKGVVVKITNEDPLMVKYVSVSIETEEGIMRAQTNDEGIAQFPNLRAGSIILIHLLFPDRSSIFKITNKEHNYFEFRIEPSIRNVYFNDFKLKIYNNDLIGGHPLIGGEQYNYIKKK